MSIINDFRNESRGGNRPYQSSVLKGLQQIKDNGDEANLLLATLNSVLSEGKDFEAKLVVDSLGVTFLEVRSFDVDSGTLGTPLYYLPGSTTPETPTAPIKYINPETLLSQIVSNTTGLNLEATQLLVKAVLDAIKLDTANLDVALSTRATEATQLLNNTALLNIFAQLDVDLSTRASESTLNSLLTAFNAEDFATSAKQDTLLSNIITRLNTLGQKVSAASAPVVLSTEQEVILNAIKTAVENIDSDLGTGGLALETTQQAIETLITSTNALLTTIDADTSNLDVLLSTRAADASVLATNALLTTIDGVLDAIKVDTGALVVDVAAIEVLITTTNSLLTTIDGVLDAIKLDTANLDVTLSTRASEATLSGINTKLTPAVITPSIIRAIGAGTIAAGAYSFSVANVGSLSGVLLGVTIKPGEVINFDAGSLNNTYGAVSYDGTGTELLITVNS